ncbi:hypothetical protein ACFPOG_20655 [Paenibacillus aestuarii]|uniref:Uncharacterized protein n=1 Tax=Paenibacillus aestuarii TaxID=516965 RepID=A0ABW0KDN8_9BACL
MNMHPHFEKSTGYLIIEWYEKREKASPIHHYYSQRPTYLQLHPKDPKKVVRATFADKIPSWMEKYAKEHDFKSQQVTRSGEVGWWIANWRIYPDNSKPFTSPHLDGAFEQFTRMIPDVCEDIKNTVLENRETIKMNLRNYPDAFEEFGLFFRAEEIKGDGGALIIEDCIPSQGSDESDEDYRLRIERDGRLEKLVFELINSLPEPVRDEEEEHAEEVLNEEVFDLEIQDEEEEVSLEGLEFEESDEEETLEFGLEFEEDETLKNEEPETDAVGDTVVIENETTAESEEEMHIEVSLEEDELLYEGDPVEEVKSEASDDEVPSEENSGDTELDGVEQPSKLDELKVADYSDKKVVEGQFSLF